MLHDFKKIPYFLPNYPAWDLFRDEMSSWKEAAERANQLIEHCEDPDEGAVGLPGWAPVCEWSISFEFLRMFDAKLA